MTEEQKEKLEEQFNYYSYLAELHKSNLEDDDCSELYHRNIKVKWALYEALKVLGYTFVYACTKEHMGIEYWTYKLVKA